MTHPGGSIRINARVVIVADGHLLCAFVRADGFHFLPGGGVDFGEAASAALLRELGEEIGIAPERVRDLRPLGILEHAWTARDRRFHEINVVFAARIDGLTPAAPVAALEPHLAFDWIPLDALPHTDLRPAAIRPQLSLWLAGAGDWYSSTMT